MISFVRGSVCRFVAARFVVARCAPASFVQLIAFGLLLSPTVAYGQTWDGGGLNNNWSTAANWVGDVAPPAFGTANVVMAGSTRLNPNVDRRWEIFSLTFSPSFGTFNIGGQTLRISSGGISVQGGGGQTISAPIELGGTQNWIVPFLPSSLRVFDVQTTPFQLSVRGGVEFLGTISGAGRIRFLEGASQRLLRPNSYSGGTEIVSGLVEIVDDALGTGRVTLDGGTIAPLNLGGPPVTLANDFTLANGGGTIVAWSNLSISGGIDGPGGLIVGGGSSVVTLSGHNSYAGETLVQSGTLRAENATFAPGAAVNVQSGGVVEAVGEISRPLMGNGTVTAIGSLLVGDVDRTESIDFAGTLNLGQASIQFADADEAFLSGNVRIEGGTLRSTNGTRLSGTLVGFGVVEGDVINDGVVDGSDDVEPLEFRGHVRGGGRFNGNTRFTGVYSPEGQVPIELESPQFAGTIQVDIGGTQAGLQYDQLRITGAARLGGALDVTLADGFQPMRGQQFVLISGGLLEGEFATIGLPPLSGANRFAVRQGPTSLALYVVPEPASLTLVICALGGLFLLQYVSNSNVLRLAGKDTT